MKVLVVALCNNEQALLPYFFRHYKTFADNFVIVNNNSDDNSVEICEAEGAEVLGYDTNNQHIAATLSFLRNSIWQLYKCFDWTFIVDVDEFIYHPQMRQFLEDSKKYTVLCPTGYQMISDHFPTTQGQIYNEVFNGVKADNPLCYEIFNKCSFDKNLVINPNKVKETGYGVGAHECAMRGEVIELKDPELKLLHFRLLGFDYLLQRNKFRASRVTEKSKTNGCSIHYFFEEDKLRATFDKMLAIATKVPAYEHCHSA